MIFFGKIGKNGHFELLFLFLGLFIFLAISDIFYPSFMGKIVNLILKNVKKYENYWKHKYDNIYV